jgi:hypothetical protein
VKKNRLKFCKNRPVRFRFYKPKTEKTEPNPNRKKPEKNRVKPKKPIQTGFCPKKPNRTETGRFELVLVFFLNIDLVTFYLIKTEPNQK